MSMLSVDYIHSTVMASMQFCMASKPFCMRGLQQAYCSPRRSLRCLCSWGRPRRSFAHTFSKPAAIQSSLVCTSCHSWLALLLLVVCTSCHSCHRPLEPGCAHCRMRHFTTVAGYACRKHRSTITNAAHQSSPRPARSAHFPCVTVPGAGRGPSPSKANRGCSPSLDGVLWWPQHAHTARMTRTRHATHTALGTDTEVARRKDSALSRGPRGAQA